MTSPHPTSDPVPAMDESAMTASEEDRALMDLIRDAIKFTNWAAGEGLSCVDASVPEPDDILFRYATETGYEDWDTIPEHVIKCIASIRARAAAEATERAAKMEQLWDWLQQHVQGLHNSCLETAKNLRERGQPNRATHYNDQAIGLSHVLDLMASSHAAAIRADLTAGQRETNREG